jgi:hypothetical protein
LAFRTGQIVTTPPLAAKAAFSTKNASPLNKHQQNPLNASVLATKTPHEPDDMDDVSKFLQDVKEMNARRTEEDDARQRELDEKIQQEKRERRARRAGTFLVWRPFFFSSCFCLFPLPPVAPCTRSVEVERCQRSPKSTAKTAAMLMATPRF